MLQVSSDTWSEIVENAMPDELYILLVVERENEVYSHECPFNTIFITGMSNTDILGRYCAEDVIGDDCLLHYRKYVKDKTATSGLCILYMQHEENTVFYHLRRYRWYSKKNDLCRESNGG